MIKIAMKYLTATNASSDKHNGFTLVEALLSMLILIFVILGLLQTIIMATDANVKVSLRDNAVKLATDELEDYRNMAVASIQLGTSSSVKTMRFKNSDFNYTVQRIGTPTTGNSVRMQINVSWSYRSSQYTYNTSTIIQ